MIRPVDAADREAVVAMGEEFFITVPISAMLGYDRESAGRSFDALVGNPDAGIFVMEREGEVAGVIAGMVTPYLFNFSVRVCQEFMWFVRPEYRGHMEAARLEVTLQVWGERKGSILTMMAKHAGSPPSVERYLRRRGYEEQETVYIRRNRP